MKFNVPEMSCGHCVSAIEKSIKAKDPAATVDANLEQHQVTIQSGLAQQDVQKAIAEAGYDATVA